MYPSLTPVCTGLLELTGSGLELLKSTFHAENFICRFSWFIFSHFSAIQSWNACRSPKSQKKFNLTPIFGVQGHSRSSMLTFLRSLSPVLVMISSISVPICNHFHVRRANSGRITPFKGGCPSFAPSFMGAPFTQWHEILSQNTRDSKLSYGENPKSLSHLVS